MLIELFLLLQSIALITFGIGFFRRNEWMWSLSILIFAILIFSSYNIEKNKSIITNQTMVGNTITYEHDIISQSIVEQTYSYLNILFFTLSLIMFFFDLFNNWKENKSVRR